MSTAGPQERRGPNRLLTVVIATIASVVAAVITSNLFDGGVVGSAAITPVIVALVTEVLSVRRPRGGSRPGPDRPEPDQPEPPPRRRLGVGGIVVAILIGLLAFVIAVFALTIPEVAADQTITGESGETTFFGTNEGTPWGEGRSWSDCFDDIEQCVRDIVEENR